MVDVSTLTDLPTPVATDYVLTWRGSAPYRMAVGYFPSKNADGQWLFSKVNGGAGASGSAVRLTENGAAGGGYLAGSATEVLVQHNCEAINGTGVVARAATAGFVRINNGNLEFYGNTGLTIGSAFTPTLRMTVNGATGAVSMPGAVACGAVASTSNGAFDGGMNVKGTMFLGAPLIQNLAADSTTFYMRGTTFAVQNAGASSTFLQVNSSTISPGTDNVTSGGLSYARYSVIYAATGTINTSDERLKKWRGGLTPDELRAAKLIAAEIGVYQWLEAVAEKGEAARLHVGVRAQRAFAIMKECGLRWQDYGWCCYDKWDDQYRPKFKRVPVAEVLDEEGNIVTPAHDDLVEDGLELHATAGDRYGVRPDQLAMFLIAAQEQRIAALELALPHA